MNLRNCRGRVVFVFVLALIVGNLEWMMIRVLLSPTVLHNKTPPLNEMQGSRYDAPLALSANAYSAPACSGNFRDSEL